jgi:site-specific recombinase XerD
MIRLNPKPSGKPPNTSAKQKVLILHAKDLAQFSNRKMANLSAKRLNQILKDLAERAGIKTHRLFRWHI